MDQSDPSDDPLVPLAEEFAERHRRGERPSLTEYVENYPELAGRIRHLFPAMVVMEDFGSVESRAGETVRQRDPAPRQLGDYRILGEVGRGGMGVVYEAEQVSLGRRVALKVLPRQTAGDGRLLGRFRREARSAARLHHTNIVPVYEVGQDGDVCYYAMQLIEGQGLDLVIEELRRLRGRSVPEAAGSRPTSARAAGTPGPSTSAPTAAAISHVAHSLLTDGFEVPSVDVTSPPPGATTGPDPASDPTRTFAESGGIALEAATARALIGPDAANRSSAPDPGGDVTRSSVLSGVMRLSAVEPGHRNLFFRGVARVGQQAAQALAYAHARGIVHRDIKPSNLLLDAAGLVWVTDFGLAKAEDDGLTDPGDVLGTLRFMAPERFRGEGDGRADVYALGLTLYELLTLRPAFDSADRLQLVEQVKTREPVRPRALDPRIPRDLETVVLKAIDKDPSRRYQAAEDMAEDLRRFLADEPIQARRVSPWRRVVLWARRRPAEAALVAVGSLAALALIGTAVSLWYGGQLKQERDLARRFQYFQHISLANAAWGDGSMARLEKLLDTCPAGLKDHWEWRYLKRQCHSEILRLVGHKGGIFDIDFRRDGKSLASASLDGTVKLWDAGTGQVLKTLIGNTNEVFGVAFSPAGTTLASTSSDGTVRLWDATTGQEIRRIDLGVGRYAWHVAYSLDGERLASAGSDGTIRVWDLTTGKQSDWIGGHSAAVNKVAFSPDGKYLASTGSDGMVCLWDAMTGRVLFPLAGHLDNAIGVAFSPDGKHLATGSVDRTVRIWEVKTGRFVHDLRGHVGSIDAVAFSPDGELLASASGDPSVKLWDWRSGTEVRTIRGHGGEVFDLAFSPDGTLATASHDLTIKLWRVADDPAARSLAGHVGAVNGVAFHPGGRVVASAGQDKTIKLWDVATGRLNRTLVGGHDEAVLSVTFHPGGQTLASADKKGVVRLWDLATGRMSRPLDDDHGGEVSGMAFRPDGERLATAGMDGVVRVWEVKTLRKVRTYPGHLRSVRSLAYSPDGKSLASGGEDRTVIVRDATGDRVISAREGHTCWVHAVAYSPDGRRLSTSSGIGPGGPATARLASVSGDGSIKIWDAMTGELVLPIQGHGNDVRGVTFSPDGSRLASASMDRTVKLWDVESGDEVLALRGHTGGVLGVAFSPDGNLLASAGTDGTVRIWDASPWAASSRERGIDPVKPHRP